MRIYLDTRDAFVRELASDELASDGVELVPELTADVDAVVLDDHGDGDDELTARIGKANAVVPDVPVILLTTGERLSNPPEGVTDMASKPLRAGVLLGRIRLARRWNRRKRSRYEAILAMAIDSAGDVVEITTPDPIIEYVNPAFERTLGYSRAEAVGRSPGSLIRSDAHDAAYFQNIDRTLKSGKAWKGLLVSQAKDGRLVHLETTISPIFDERGQMSHHVAVKRDISARMKTEAELRRLNAELETARDTAIEANAIKSQFLANMSHELRTPLNAIIGYSEMMCEEAEDEGLEDFVGDLTKISRAGSHLLSLINDILDLSKIEAGRMEIYLEQIDVGDAVAAVASTVDPLIKDRGNELRLDVAPDLPALTSDVTKLRQTLLNLVSNANKFTDKGRVDVMVDQVEHADEAGIRIRVVDQGIGMSDVQMSKLFQPFVQADASTTRKYGGTGLGLAICQRFCEMLGGSIDVSSEVGKGSVFTVWLPVAGPKANEGNTQRLEGDGARVLVIDDDASVLDLVSRALGKRGFLVTTANDGASGLAAVAREQPDVIVLDVMMPGMDGWEVLSRLKADAETREIPVVVLTMLEQQDVGLALGAVDFMLKPFRANELARMLRRWCQRDIADVLVIEDDEATRELMRRTLEAAGHQVREAENGRVGLERARTKRPDIVLLDLMMPEMDGFEVLDAFKSDEQLSSVPVIVATAKTLTAAEQEALASAQRVFQKGEYSRRELLELIEERVAEVLRLGRGSVVEAQGDASVH